jgi:hypothetical protein
LLTFYSKRFCNEDHDIYIAAGIRGEISTSSRRRKDIAAQESPCSSTLSRSSYSHYWRGLVEGPQRRGTMTLKPESPSLGFRPNISSSVGKWIRNTSLRADKSCLCEFLLSKRLRSSQYQRRPRTRLGPSVTILRRNNSSTSVVPRPFNLPVPTCASTFHHRARMGSVFGLRRVVPRARLGRSCSSPMTIISR